MKETVSFILGRSDQDVELEHLKELLKETGVEVSIRTNEVVGYSILNISVDKNYIKQKQKRNAGRPFKIYKGRYTCGEIREKLKTMTKQEVADELNISRRTLYRRLKENEGYADDKEFL